MSNALRVEGWAAIYDDVDLNGDIVAPGAFRKSLAKSGSFAVKFLYQHAAEQPIGRWLRFEERARGLYAYGEIIPATRTAREVAELARAEIIDGLSIGFRTVKAAKSHGARRITEAELWEVSIVTFPMAPKARLTRIGDEPLAGGAQKEQSIRALAAQVREAAKILSA
ncbi:MAG: HK97 family phage prohead protease [Parvularculaceae bacterium]|nr:HK97 family phage prohead protease [Parvularculaceae bacterium]